MESKWRKVKLAFGSRMCLSVPKTLEDGSPAPVLAPERFSDAVSLSSAVQTHRSSNGHQYLDMPTTPVPSSSGLRLPKQSSRSSKRTCAICLNTMKPGYGHAIFTAECSHSFHFQCIASNVKHGNHMCPVCRARWKDVPFQSPSVDVTHHGRSRRQQQQSYQDDPWMSVVRRLPPTVFTNRGNSSSIRAPVPDIFNDDETVDYQHGTTENNSSLHDVNGGVQVEAFTEFSAISKSDSRSNFAVLIHVKAPGTNTRGDNATGQNSRAPVDLVTALDVSGSMAGTKLALLKRAMGFVIQNLGPCDRLSVIAFSSTARRLFPLRKMNDTGKTEALHAVNALTANGGTNIAEALKIGAKVMSERKMKNTVSSMILLSDGQDTYTNTSPGNTHHRSLLPVSMHRDHESSVHIPVHAFGFGVDHDAVSMHSISESSGGTFSFIEAEAVIQDAFAQCIGGLLSVVVQDLALHVECMNPNIRLTSLKTGSYKNSLNSNARIGVIQVGDLYAEEERDFLVSLDVPSDKSSNETSLVTVRCFYKDPISKDLVTIDHSADAKIQRPEKAGPLVVSMEVDKQLNRLYTAESMSLAKAAAEHGDLAAAVSILDNRRKQLAESVSFRAGDRLSVALDAELREMQERMANRQVYEASGRAYVLSGLSSHSWQRATARGDSTESTSMVHAYQTPSMVDMVSRSQTMTMIAGNNPHHQRPFRPGRSHPLPPQPR